jgi:hypothetical protein
MPGQIKVSGTWRTAGSALVKVSGSWRSVTSGWVKVGGVWKQWFIGLIADTFTRTTSGSLGTANTGQSWTSKFGVWYANGSQARSDAGTSPNTAGAVALIDIGNANATVSLGNSGATGVTPGIGVAFWSTAAGSWWGAISYSDQTSYTYSCNPSYSCSSCSTCTSQTTSGTSYNATATTTTTYTYVRSATQTAATYHAATSYCTYYDIRDESNTGCYNGTANATISTTGHGAAVTTAYYSCSSGVLSGLTCYSCSGYTNGPVSGVGGTVNDCFNQNTDTTYSCNSPSDTRVGVTCTTPDVTTTPTYPNCTYGFSSVAATGSYPNCGCPANSGGAGESVTYSTCTGYNNNYYLQVLYSSVGGAAYTVQSTNTTTSEVKSINVSTSGNNYSVTAYNSSYSSLGTWSGTNSSTKGTQHGIVKAYSSYAQGSTADNFSAQGQ